MLRFVNSPPMLFAKPLQIKDRERFRHLKCIGEEMSDFLRDRPMLPLRSSLELSVESVREIFDVQNCHRLLLYSSFMEDTI
jgi:hypothetical protein